MGLRFGYASSAGSGPNGPQDDSYLSGTSYAMQIAD